ncbi:dTDP-glucose 4,6-dehydratase [Novipirellula aureliae]|uniref:dTDP-glucose 4,6-dehydratase n=1 Tax=Novipirellula aureliae TaxID=2527966 RepID=A0A5C6DVR8_9BACT|nr:NAD-dependent epimerase/dehydratase family protein [Novipirellula aureliae]TWU41483.1 dTDP-glucose 4,6-dehydratase [Novipirellula aureliae]
MRVFVTGGTGLLGNNVLRQLEAAGHESVALVRQPPESKVFAGLSTRLVHGDLFSEETIDRAVADCDAVVHSAALIHLGWTRLAESMRINRDGTKAIVDACIKYDRKLLHVGTVDSIAIGSKRAPANESTPMTSSTQNIPCSYVVSKKASVETVLDGVRRGLRATIVHPGFMLGPWDWKPSSGRMIVEVSKAWRPFAPRGGASVCDVRDVAAAVIAGIEHASQDGRQYILGGHNITYFQLWKEITRRTGTRGPVTPTGPLALWVAGIVGDFKTRITNRESDINSAAIRMSSLFHWYDSSRAENELGYQIRGLEETLDDAIQWIC